MSEPVQEIEQMAISDRLLQPGAAWALGVIAEALDPTGPTPGITSVWLDQEFAAMRELWADVRGCVTGSGCTHDNDDDCALALWQHAYALVTPEDVP